MAIDHKEHKFHKGPLSVFLKGIPLAFAVANEKQRRMII
jgi:hypothetical protein